MFGSPRNSAKQKSLQEVLPWCLRSRNLALHFRFSFPALPFPFPFPFLPFSFPSLCHTWSNVVSAETCRLHALPAAIRRDSKLFHWTFQKSIHAFIHSLTDAVIGALSHSFISASSQGIMSAHGPWTAAQGILRGRGKANMTKCKSHEYCTEPAEKKNLLTISMWNSPVVWKYFFTCQSFKITKSCELSLTYS